jgi:hypothetical protein
MPGRGNCLGGCWRRGRVLVLQAVGPAAREGQGRDLTRALRPRGWRGPLSKDARRQFLHQLDHRGRVAEVDLPPPGVSRRGSQSGGRAGAKSTTVFRGRGGLLWAVSRDARHPAAIAGLARARRTPNPVSDD